MNVLFLSKDHFRFKIVYIFCFILSLFQRRALSFKNLTLNIFQKESVSNKTCLKRRKYRNNIMSTLFYMTYFYWPIGFFLCKSFFYSGNVPTSNFICTFFFYPNNTDTISLPLKQYIYISQY